MPKSQPWRRRTTALHLSTRGALAVTLLAVALVAAASLDARAGKRHRARARAAAGVERSDILRGALVVKYRDSVDSCVHCLLAAGRELCDATRVDGEAFQRLHERFQVRSARPVFREVREERERFPGLAVVPTAELRRLHLERQLAILDRFPGRSARIGAGADLPELHHVYLLDLPRGVDPRAAAAAFGRDPNVEYAHPDYRMHVDLEPDDPYFHSAGSWGQEEDDLWGLKGDKLDAASAWDVSMGEGTVVAVVDTGVDVRHEDIAANIWRNPGEVPGNGVDDDGNGFVDDVGGWDFTTCARFNFRGCKTPKQRDADPRDDHFHGTHVAGTIAAVGDNGRGIVGVAPRASLMPVKALNSQGIGTSADLAAAIVYAASTGADVLNNSWGCGLCPSIPVEEDAVRTAHGLGAVVVFAAGNSATDSRIRSPQNMRRPKPVVVAASDPGDRPTFFTSFGVSVDVAGPGGGDGPNILSLKKSGGCSGGCRGRSLGKYLRLWGTSMAAPHASGVAALVLARDPTLTPDQVRQVLRQSSDDTGPPGFDLKSGEGRLDAGRAVRSGAPLRVEITAPADSAAKPGRRVTVRGTAGGAGFREARLWAAAEGDDGWTAIGGPWRSPFSGRQLGRALLRPGWNRLRLEATTADGRTYADTVSMGRQPRYRRIGEELPGLAMDPDVSNGRIVWFQVEEPIRRQIGHVYLYDRRGGRLARLTDEAGTYRFPRVSGDRIAWEREVERNRHELVTCVVEAGGGECRAEVVATGVNVIGVDKLALSGDRVVFETDFTAGVVTLDIASGEQVFLVDQHQVGAVRGFDIDGDWVVWSQPTGRRQAEIRLFDWALRETEPLVSGEALYGPRIGGGVVAYREKPPDADLLELRVLDLATGADRLLDGNTQAPFDVSGRRVAWIQGSDVRLSDASPGGSHAVVLQPLTARTAPRLSANELVWIDVVDFDWGAGELRYARVK